jgi:hypothetical protein
VRVAIFLDMHEKLRCDQERPAPAARHAYHFDRPCLSFQVCGAR